MTNENYNIKYSFNTTINFLLQNKILYKTMLLGETR